MQRLEASQCNRQNSPPNTHGIIKIGSIFLPLRDLKDRISEKPRAGISPGTGATSRRAMLSQFHFAQPIRPLQHFARLTPIRRANNSIALHHIQNARRAAVTQP